MRTKTWSGSGLEPSAADGGAGTPQSPLDWMKTPVFFVTLKTQPAELELVSGCYQVWRHLKDRVPFTLTLRNGHVLASLSHDEFVMDDVFKTPFFVFDKVMTLECQRSVQLMLDSMDARLRVAEGRRVEGQPQAEHQYPQPVQPQPASSPMSQSTDQATAAPQRQVEQAAAPVQDASPVAPAAAEPTAAPRDDIRAVLSGAGAQPQRAEHLRRRR